VSLTARSSLQDVALAVGAQLTRRGIRAVLTGGACVAIYTGTYVSSDADFILQGNVRQRALDEAMRQLGFERHGDRYDHPETPFFVEFPPGPLSIGEDLAIRPVEMHVAEEGSAVLALSPTDSCRDRLAAFYHWDDRQALRLAVEIARKHEVDFHIIKVWSVGEGMSDKYDEFLREAQAGTAGLRRLRRRRSRDRRATDDAG